jgi:hypothetical protein
MFFKKNPKQPAFSFYRYILSRKSWKTRTRARRGWLMPTIPAMYVGGRDWEDCASLGKEFMRPHLNQYLGRNGDLHLSSRLLWEA